tara:strand:+ start:28612 stop:28902 length:291 start_codon:yes stop_codon:yes gene_type:complete
MTLDHTELRDLEISIADRIYIQIAKWNLYLGDAGLAMKLAIECNSHLSEGANVAARKSVELLKVDLGGGNTTMPLARLISPGQILDLEEILEPYCR